jgi:hypothetical protein
VVYVYALATTATNIVFLKDAKVLQGPCPSCNSQNFTYFGDILTVQGNRGTNAVRGRPLAWGIALNVCGIGKYTMRKTNSKSYPYNKHGPFSSPKLWYLPNHRDALHAHMHLLHKLGNAKTEANYCAYYQTLIKDGTANGAPSNVYLTNSNVPFKTKCIIMKYKTGTLYNQKHAVLFKLSTIQTCPLYP